MSLVGYCDCPECGDEAAEVRRDKKGKAYRRCPECGSVYFTHGGDREAALLKKMRQVDGAGSKPENVEEPREDAPAEKPAAPARKKSFLEELLS